MGSAISRKSRHNYRGGVHVLRFVETPQTNNKPPPRPASWNHNLSQSHHTHPNSIDASSHRGCFGTYRYTFGT